MRHTWGTCTGALLVRALHSHWISARLGTRARERIDIIDDVADRFKPLWFAKFDVQFVLNVADQLYHIKRIDAQRLKRRVNGYGVRVDVKVMSKCVFDKLKRVHGNPFNFHVERT